MIVQVILCTLLFCVIHASLFTYCHSNLETPTSLVVIPILVIHSYELITTVITFCLKKITQTN